MADLYGWLIVIAGATIGFLGTILLASERELRKKGRECEELRARQSARTVAPSAEVQRAEGPSSAELIARNEELVEKVGLLSSRLEESQRTVDELQSVQRSFACAQAEEGRLREVITNLRDELQMSNSRLDESNRRHQEAAEVGSKLQREVVRLQQRLQENQETEEKRRSVQERLLLDARSENQQLWTENQQLQQDIANLRDQLRANEARLSTSASRYQEIADRELQFQTELGELRQRSDKLTMENNRLKGEIDLLSSKLTASERTVEHLERIQHDAQAENQRLHATIRELEQEIAGTRERLQMTETHLSELAGRNEEATARCVRLQSEVADLKQQMEQTETRARDSEALQQQLVQAESRERIFTQQHHELEAQMALLQRELSAGREKILELDATHNRLVERERDCQELRDQKRRLEEEILDWQERLAASEENRRDVDRLRQQLEELQMAYSLLKDKSEQKATYAIELTQEAIGPESNSQVTRMPVIMQVSEVSSPVNDRGEDNGNHGRLNDVDSAPSVHVANVEPMKPGVRASGKPKWRFGLVPAVVVLVIGCAAAVGFLATRSSESKEAAALSETLPDEPSAPIEAATIKGETKLPPRLRGAFKVTRPTGVYSGPSENSALIANIEPGMKINVVDFRDGWLEIRSKHGRPPGFVRQEAAVRIDRN